MIELATVTVTFKDDSKGLTHVDLTVPRGQCLVLTGKSGCGKTTLLSCLNGIVLMEEEWSVSGTITVADQIVQPGAQEKLVKIVGSVFQNPRTQFFTTTVLDELTFVCENLAIPKEDIHQALTEVLPLFNIDDLLSRSMFELSSGEQQLVALAAAYLQKPAVLVLDEPTSNLDFSMTRRIKEVLLKLKEQGVTLVIADHRLLYLADLADRIVILDEGQPIYDDRMASFKALPLKTRRDFGLRVVNPRELPLPQDSDVARAHDRSEAYLSLTDVTVRYPKKPRALAISKLNINQGEILSIVGHNGAGKTTLLKVLAGLQKPSKGTILHHGTKITQKSLRKQAYLVLQDAALQLLGETVQAELALFTKNKERQLAAAELFDLTKYLSKHPFSLSGGEQQRLALAGAFLANKDLIILDEPTSGLDWEHMEEVIAGIKTLQSWGKTVIVVSHDWEFLCHLGGPMIHLKNGQIVTELIDYQH